MRKYFLFCFTAMLLFAAAVSPGWAELDPNILWVSDSTLGGFDGFAIHPNGNIIAYHHGNVCELDGKTGKLVRTLPVFTTKNKIDMIKVSSDGKYMISSYDEVNIVNYETGELVKRIPNMGKVSIYPDNNRIIGLRYNGGSLDSGLIVYNIINDKFEYYKLDYGYSNLELSPDGKYFAMGISGTFSEGGYNKDYTFLKLWDTETHTEIKTLGKYEGNNDVNYIKFSPDGKFVGFQVYLDDLYIFNTNDYTLFKHYSDKNPTYGFTGFCFINNENIGTKDRKTYIINLKENKLIYEFNTIGGAYPIIEYNKIYNSLVVADVYIKDIDINKIINSVNDNNNLQNLIITYSNGILTIENIQTSINSVNITIIDINGKIMRKIKQQTTDGKLEIPIKLTNGTYILSIKDGDKEYSSKFLVTN